MKQTKTYSTGQVAKIIGVHPNTVRMYEEMGLISKADRAPNGYRIFTQTHIEQFQIARTAFQIEVLQSGLRKKIISVVKLTAAKKYAEAVKSTNDYLLIAKSEIENARQAVQIVNRIFQEDTENSSQSYKRKEAAAELGITIDTLRNWELNGLISIKRKENRYRIYTEKDMQRLRIIRALRCANYSLSSILRMLTAYDQNCEINTLIILNTPARQEDIVLACDKLILSLQNAVKNAAVILSMLEKLQKENPPL